MLRGQGPLDAREALRLQQLVGSAKVPTARKHVAAGTCQRGRVRGLEHVVCARVHQLLLGLSGLAPEKEDDAALLARDQLDGCVRRAGRQACELHLGGKSQPWCRQASKELQSHCPPVSLQGHLRP